MEIEFKQVESSIDYTLLQIIICIRGSFLNHRNNILIVKEKVLYFTFITECDTSSAILFSY